MPLSLSSFPLRRSSPFPSLSSSLLSSRGWLEMIGGSTASLLPCKEKGVGRSSLVTYGRSSKKNYSRFHLRSTVGFILPLPEKALRRLCAGASRSWGILLKIWWLVGVFPLRFSFRWSLSAGGEIIHNFSPSATVLAQHLAGKEKKHTFASEIIQGTLLATRAP